MQISGEERWVSGMGLKEKLLGEMGDVRGAQGESGGARLMRIEGEANP